MSKIQIFLFTLAFVAMAFSVGYKVGDAHGYNEGYDVGYSYDCREQINTLVKRSDSLDKVVQNLNQSCQNTVWDNERLKYDRWADSVRKTTGKKVVSFDSAIKRNQTQVRETMRFGKEHGLY